MATFGCIIEEICLLPIHFAKLQLLVTISKWPLSLFTQWFTFLPFLNGSLFSTYLKQQFLNFVAVIRRFYNSCPFNRNFHFVYEQNIISLQAEAMSLLTLPISSSGLLKQCLPYQTVYTLTSNKKAAEIIFFRSRTSFITC